MANVTFRAKLEKVQSKGGWTYVVPPFDPKETFGTRGYVKVEAAIDGHRFSGGLMPLGNGKLMLPIKAEIRKAIGKEAPEVVEVEITDII